MIRGFNFLILFLVCFYCVSGQSAGSQALADLLRQGRTIEATDRDRAMVLYKIAIDKADSAGIVSHEIGETCEKLANYEYYRGNTEIAITLALRALSIYEEQQNSKQATQMMILVGDILRGNELYDQSHEYLIKALGKARLQNDNTLVSATYNRLAALGVNDFRIPLDTTERFANLSLDIARAQQDGKTIYNNLNILGVVEIMRENYPKSLDYLKEALSTAREAFPEDEPLILHNMARSYFAMGLSAKAVEYDKAALKLAQELQIPQYIRLASSYLKDYYIANRNFEEGLKYAIQYYQAKDFILTQKVLVQLKEFNNRIETVKQRSENQRLIYEQKLTDGRLRNYMLIGISLVILLIVTTGFILYQYRQRRQIRMIASQLDQSNKVLMRFISVLGHDLRSPFNAILGFTDILKNEPALNPGDRDMAIDRLYTVSRSTYKLLERILEWSRLQSGSVKPNRKLCDLSELVRETIHTLEPAALLKKIEIKYDYPGPQTLLVDENMILTVIRNIISNAIKFSKPGGRIEVGCVPDPGRISFYFRDNGIGISRQNLERLFHLDNAYKSQGTAGESGTGLGLILCKEYLAMHGGTLDVKSEEGKGSTFTISIEK